MTTPKRMKGQLTKRELRQLDTILTMRLKCGYRLQELHEAVAELKSLPRRKAELSKFVERESAVLLRQSDRWRAATLGAPHRVRRLLTNKKLSEAIRIANKWRETNGMGLRPFVGGSR